LQDVYLRHNPYVLNPDSGHFRLRPTPRVQPLSTRVSYCSVTPPPPALAQIARQGAQYGLIWFGNAIHGFNSFVIQACGLQHH
jgi:hypothetical protein